MVVPTEKVVPRLVPLVALPGKVVPRLWALVALPEVLLHRLHAWALTGQPAIQSGLNYALHITFCWMLLTATAMIVFSDPSVHVTYTQTAAPAQIYYWEVTAHGGTIIAAFLLVYAHKWRQPGVALIPCYWLLLVACLHLVLVLARKETGLATALLLHGFLSASYLYLAALTVSWVQHSNHIDRMLARKQGELDDFDEVQLEVWFEERFGERASPGPGLEEPGRQAEVLREGRVAAWAAAAGREAAGYIPLLYSLHFAGGRRAV
jgi:hypothetical protein